MNQLEKDYTQEGFKKTIDFSAWQFLLTDSGMIELAKVMTNENPDLAMSLMINIKKQLNEGK